jgi:hypothetical protein
MRNPFGQIPQNRTLTFIVGVAPFGDLVERSAAADAITGRRIDGANLIAWRLYHWRRYAAGWWSISTTNPASKSGFSYSPPVLTGP